jgi:kynureninase
MSIHKYKIIHSTHSNFDMLSTQLPSRNNYFLSSKNTYCPLEFMPRPGALGFIYSTPSMLQIASLMGSLQVFDKTSMVSLREKSLLLTGYLHSLLTTEIPPNFLRIMTPEDPSQRGAQLSLKLPKDKLLHVFSRLQNSGIICDERKPDCIRLAPVPLYSQFEDVRRSVEVLKGILKDICDSTTSC